jgi:hypothetical protein
MHGNPIEFEAPLSTLARPTASPMSHTDSEPSMPLARTTVLDLTIARAGPTAVRLLAD